MKSVATIDLEGAPYLYGGRDPAVGVDCLFTARTVLARIYPDLAPSELPLDAQEAEAAMGLANDGKHRWRRVPMNGPLRVGDVIYTVRGDDHLPGTAVVVSENGPLVLTALPEVGVRKCTYRSLRGVKAIYRRGSA